LRLEELLEIHPQVLVIFISMQETLDVAVSELVDWVFNLLGDVVSALAKDLGLPARVVRVVAIKLAFHRLDLSLHCFLDQERLYHQPGYHVHHIKENSLLYS
jgi:hypothetical protein